jgi:hypothetical protein
LVVAEEQEQLLLDGFLLKILVLLELVAQVPLVLPLQQQVVTHIILVFLLKEALGVVPLPQVLLQLMVQVQVEQEILQPLEQLHLVLDPL